MISFIHAADLHLDSPFRGMSEIDEDVAGVLRRATFESFDCIVQACIDREVDFFVAAGDIYDGADRSLKAQLAFRDGLARLSDAGIPSFTAHGNHDPLSGWAARIEWPCRAHVFPGQVTCFTVEDKAVVHGVSYPQREVAENLAVRFRRTESDLPQVGVLHCNVGADTGHAPYAPCSVEDMKRAGMDYWALGHVHKRSRPLGDRPVAAYPGSIQGLHINEPGPHGCLLVRIDGEETTTEFLAADRVRWHAESVDIFELDSEQGLFDVVEGAFSALSNAAEGRLVLCSLTLTGRGPLHEMLQKPGNLADFKEYILGLGRDMNPMIRTCSLNDETRPAACIQELRENEDFLGDLLKIAWACRNEPELIKELEQSLKPLYRHHSLSRCLQPPDPEELAELIERAESLCVDALTGGGS